jgi:hypothetical protein
VLRGEVQDAVAAANRAAASSDVELPIDGTASAGVSVLASLGVNRAAKRGSAADDEPA